MALLERVSTLLRANLNDLIEKAEDPERLLKQLVLDMENQLLQVKTQVAIAIADEHLLERKRKEHEQQGVEWKRKAELAVTKGHDDLARGALERARGVEVETAVFVRDDYPDRGADLSPGHRADRGPGLRRSRLRRRLFRHDPDRHGWAGGGHRLCRAAGCLRSVLAGQDRIPPLRPPD